MRKLWHSIVPQGRGGLVVSLGGWQAGRAHILSLIVRCPPRPRSLDLKIKVHGVHTGRPYSG